MQPDNAQGLIEEAARIAEKMSPLETDGLWLEDITTQVGPLIKEWDISACYLWPNWPNREKHFPRTTGQDIGIDAVAIRRSDDQHIAIQCKARKLDENGHGDTIPKGEIDKFANPSANDFWAERWLVTNGDNPMGDNALQALKMGNYPFVYQKCAYLGRVPCFRLYSSS
jgi:predicted helicase